MPNIIVAEDDPGIASLVQHYLERAGHDVEVVSSGAMVLTRVRERRPDLLVLDLMLPEVNGLEICRALRAEPATASLPIIMVTARGEEVDRVVGLEIGADDYVTKPFSPRELVARVAAMLRRASREPVIAGMEGPVRPLRYGPLELDRERHVVRDQGHPVDLTAKEFLLLEYLLMHPGRVLSRDVLLSAVWGYRYTGGTRTIDVHIRRLREKLPVLADSIITVKQFGYKLAEPGEGAGAEG